MPSQQILLRIRDSGEEIPLSADQWKTVERLLLDQHLAYRRLDPEEVLRSGDEADATSVVFEVPERHAVIHEVIEQSSDESPRKP